MSAVFEICKFLLRYYSWNVFRLWWIVNGRISYIAGCFVNLHNSWPMIYFGSLMLLLLKTSPMLFPDFKSHDYMITVICLPHMSDMTIKCIHVRFTLNAWYVIKSQALQTGQCEKCHTTFEMFETNTVWHNYEAKWIFGIFKLQL